MNAVKFHSDTFFVHMKIYGKCFDFFESDIVLRIMFLDSDSINVYKCSAYVHSIYF